MADQRWAEPRNSHGASPSMALVRVRSKSAVGSEETGARYSIQRNQIAPSGGIRKVTDAGWPCHT